jgi:hypothetical protein
MVDKLKHIYLFYWYFQQNQCLNIKKHAVHNIHRLAWGSYACETPGQLPNVPMRYDGTGCDILLAIHIE